MTRSVFAPSPPPIFFGSAASGQGTASRGRLASSTFLMLLLTRLFPHYTHARRTSVLSFLISRCADIRKYNRDFYCPCTATSITRRQDDFLCSVTRHC